MTDLHMQVIEQMLIEPQGKSQLETNIVKVTNGAPRQTTEKSRIETRTDVKEQILENKEVPENPII